MHEFGIYVLTYPGDFHLSLPLIRSLKYFHPNIPIMIIPGEGLDRRNHPFNADILPEPEGFWATIGHQSRDFWAFQGPFEKFLYLDADLICTGSLDSFFGRLRTQDGPFLFAHICFTDQMTWKAIIQDKKHPMHQAAITWVKNGLGNPELLTQFDTEYDPYARAPFNSGIFAGRRSAITEADLKALLKKEALFYEKILKKAFTWKCNDLFYGDQGRLNYLVDKLKLPLMDLYPDGHDFWAGDIVEKVTVEKFMNNRLKFKFIHWAGVPRPRPSVFCQPLFRWIDPLIYDFENYKRYEGFPEIPGYALWHHFQVRNEYPMRITDRLSSSYLDLLNLGRTVKFRAKARFHRLARSSASRA
jgi:hypothetical protein